MTIIKTVTHCPTCGSECKVEGEGETHYYIPKNKYTEEDMKSLIEFLRNNKVGNMMLNCNVVMNGTQRAPTSQDVLDSYIQSLPPQAVQSEMSEKQIQEMAKIEANDNKHEQFKLNYQDGIYYGFQAGFKKAKSLTPPDAEKLIEKNCLKCGRSAYSKGKPFCTDEFCN